jgi:16S rRNA (adenine1518-N6/adenine1519-N6)-dimethyltransferase
MTPSRFATPLPPLNAAAILRTHGLRPDKSLGQNFLQDSYALEKITAAAEILPTDTVLEVGPGLGALTRHLAAAAKQVIAVELDGRLLPPLQETLTGYTNVEIVHGDMLKLAPAEIVPVPDYLVVANIPYYITSALLRHLLETTPRPRRVVLTVQKEVAERICAAPGDMSLLALSVQVYGQPRRKWIPPW